MSVIIRLQGLPWSASAMDIRNFFKGLSVPPGGVHIIGGDKGDAFIAFSSDEDARQAMMLNMGYIGDGQIFLFLSSKAEMQRTIEEAKLHSSASGGSIASSTQPPAQQAVSVSQPQQLQLQQQQDPYLGTRYPHTSEPEGQGYMGRGPERTIAGAQDTGMYGQQLPGVQTYGGQTKPSAPNEYGSRILPPREVYDNHVGGSRGAEPSPHPNHDKAFGVASQFITQRDGYAGQEPYPFSVQDPKDRKSYPPTSRPTHDVNFRDPRQARPDVNPPVSQQHWERGDSIAPYHDSDPQRIDQGRGPPLRPVYPGNAPDLDAGRPPRREPWEGSMPPGHEHLYSGQNEISRGRIDRGNLMPGHVQGAFHQHSKLEGPQPQRGIDGRMDPHSQNRPDVPALGRSDIPTQRQDIPPHAAGPDVPLFRRMDGVPPNRTDYPPSGPVGGPPPNRSDVYGRPEGPPLVARDSPQHGRPDVPPYSRPGAPPYGHPDERFGGSMPARNDRPQYASPADGMHRDRFDGPPSKMPDQFGVRDVGLPPAGRGRPDQHDMMAGRHTDRPDVTKGGRPDLSVPDRPDIPLRGPPGFPRPDGRPDGLPHPHPEGHPLFGRGDPRHIDGSGPRPRPGDVHHGMSTMTSPAGRPSDLPERQQDDARFRDANPNSIYGGPPRSFEEAKGFVADFDRRRPPVQGPAGEIPSAQQKHVPPPSVSSANNAPDAAKAEVRERESDTDARSSSQRSSREPDTSVSGRRSRDRDRSRSRERDRTRDRDRDRDKDRSRDKERDRDKDRDRKSRDRERDRDRRDRDRDRTRHSRDRDRDRDRDRRERDRKSKDDDHDRDRRSSRSRDDKDKSERSEADRKQIESNEPKNSAPSKDVMHSKPPAVSPATVKPAVPDEKKGPNASPAARPENNKKSQLGLLGPAPEGFPVMFPDVNQKNKTPVTARGTPGAVNMPIGQPKIVPPTPSIASVAQEGGSVSNNLGMVGHGNMPQGGRNLKNDSKNIDNIPMGKNKAAAFPGEREPVGLHNDKSRREERDIMHPRDLEASIPKGNEGNFPISDAFENRKPSFPAEWMPGPGRSSGMGMAFRDRSPHVRLPRTSGPPSLLDWRGPSDRFPSPDVRPNLGQVNEFGRPVGPRPLGPVDPRGTKRPHPDENGQAPPLTVIAKGMPTTISYRDVRRLFGNCEIPRDGLKLINDSKGDRIGVALVKFITSEGYYKALDKNGSLLNNHVVEVYPCPRQEFENAIDSYVPKKDFSDDFNKPSPADDVNLRIAQLNGLPREVTVEDIQRFFQGIKIANNGFCVYIEFDQAGSASGNAFVEFETQDDFKNALKNDCKTIGFRPIHVSAGSYKDIEALVNRQEEMWKDNPDMLKKHRIPNGKAKDVNIGQCFCIQIKHVPPFATGRDVRDLLSGLEIAPRGLQICHDAFGRPTGDAFVEFASAETASRALERRGRKIGPYDVDISLITKAEMIEKLRKARSIELLEPKKQHCFVKAENLPFNVTVGEILNFFRGYDPIPETIRLNVDNASPSQGKSAALIGFPTKEDADEAIRGVNGNIVRANKITLRHDNAE